MNGHLIPIIVIPSYLVLGWLTHHGAKVYSVAMMVLSAWGRRKKLNKIDYEIAWSCYRHYPNPLFGYEGFAFMFWPMFWIIGLLFFVVDLWSAVWQRYVVTLPRVKSQYRLIPSWLSKESLVKLINRFI